MRFELLKVVAFVKFSRDTKRKRVFPNSLNKTFKSAFSQILNAIMERVAGVTMSRATSGGRRKDRNTSGQRVNKFNTSYRDISVIVAENNSLLKPKCHQYTSLNKMLSNFSKVLMAHISFTAILCNLILRSHINEL